MKQIVELLGGPCDGQKVVFEGGLAVNVLLPISTLQAFAGDDTLDFNVYYAQYQWNVLETERGLTVETASYIGTHTL